MYEIWQIGPTLQHMCACTAQHAQRSLLYMQHWPMMAAAI